MSLRNRGVPRFLPTLTEVVQMGDSVAMADALKVPEPTPAHALIEKRLERARVAVRAHVRQALDDWLQDQLASPESTLSLKLDEVARQALLAEEVASTAS